MFLLLTVITLVFFVWPSVLIKYIYQRGMLLSLMRDICFVTLLSGVVELLEHH